MTGSIGRKKGVPLLLQIFKNCKILITVASGACGIIKDITECT